ncbi:MAG: TetR/AcrR family transcriptional regulator [Catenulispora sp.]|nr:TetR/AcrR family transcriptional regulator [Catenulispora sp.]
MTNARTGAATPSRAQEQAQAPAPAVAQTLPPAPDRPLRRDAERNRRLILEAARVVFAQHGLDASLDEVAREAGLGVGTVYRRFPNRDALVDALFDDMVASIEVILQESVALPRAWDGLVHFMTALLESQGRDKALRDMMFSRHLHLDDCGKQKDDAIRELVQDSMTDLIERSQQDGDLRADVTLTDVGVLLIAGVGIVDFTASADRDVWRRQLSVVLDGLRARPEENTPLTPAPLDDEQMDVCMTGWKYGSRETAKRRS